jgi:glycosyltransferase involved in cell wall biosynthesis
VSPRQTIILSAFACDPNLPSEPTVGWDYLREWIDIVDSQPDLRLVALMNMRSRSASLTRLRELGIDLKHVTLVGFGMRRSLSFLLHPALTRVEYLVWAHHARQYLSTHADQWDVLLARHVTFATEILPTPISALRSGTFRVWGPLGASGNIGAILAKPRSRGWITQAALQWLRERAAPAIARRIARSIDLTLAASKPFRDDLIAHGAHAELFQNVRQDESLIKLIERAAKAPARDRPRGLKLLAVGHLIPRKRFELAIAALKDPRLRSAELVIVGTAHADLKARLVQVASEAGVSDRVQFRGQVRREDVVQAMVNADVLVHPAAREGAPGVIGEATSAGLPVVVFGATGSAAVLEASGASGVEVDPQGWRSPSLIADAIVKASALPRVRSTVWTASRYEAKELELLATARQRADSTRLDPR